MTPPKPSIGNNFLKIVKWAGAIIAFVGTFGFMFTASTEWGAFKQNMEEVTFDSSAQKNDHKNHVDETPNVVENYKAMVKNEELRVELDTLLGFVTAVFADDVARIRVDSLNNANAIVSREARDKEYQRQIAKQEEMDSIQFEIQREQAILTNTNIIILGKLNEIIAKQAEE